MKSKVGLKKFLDGISFYLIGNQLFFLSRFILAKLFVTWK